MKRPDAARRRARIAVSAIAAALTVSARISAQSVAAPDTTRAFKLFTRSDAWFAGAVVGGTAAMFALDRQIARELQEPSTQTSRASKRAAGAFNAIGDPGTLVIGVGMYSIGRLAHADRMADLGLHGIEAVVVSGGVTALIKGIAGRQRPYYAGVNDPEDFSFGRGIRGGYSSFPSGHTTAAFAAATVTTLETSRWWPRSTPYVAPLMYGGASVVGLARLYSNAHWASDVVMGAGIGTLTGLKVFAVNHAPGRTRGPTRLDRWLLAMPAIAPSLGGQAGAQLAWSVALPR